MEHLSIIGVSSATVACAMFSSALGLLSVQGAQLLL